MPGLAGQHVRLVRPADVDLFAHQHLPQDAARAVVHLVYVFDANVQSSLGH